MHIILGFVFALLILFWNSQPSQARVHKMFKEDVRTEIIINWNNHHITVCRALSNIGQNIVAKFDIYPGRASAPPYYQHGTVGPVTLTHEWTIIYWWQDGTKPDPKCKPIYIGS
jgi:hypothetical protein